MSQNPYESPVYSHGMDPIAAAAATDDRIRFIRNTYLHLAGAIFAFVMIEVLLFTFAGGLISSTVPALFSMPFGWLLVLGGFIAVSWIAESWARSEQSVGMQYAGLSLYVLAESVIFVPLLYIAELKANGAIQGAAIVTLIIFGGLSAVVLLTKADFSFLRYGLYLVGIAAMAAIVVGCFMPGFLGAWFMWLMVLFASGYILYHTSNIVHVYRTDQHVAASLALFSSVALLFWYVLQLFMSDD